MLVFDLIHTHYYIMTKGGSKPAPKAGSKEITNLASRIVKIVTEGKKYELAGLKDVPKPFFKGPGKFLEFDSKDEALEASEAAAIKYVTELIENEFKGTCKDDPSEDCKKLVKELLDAPTNEGGSNNTPTAADVLFLPLDYPVEEHYEHQSGNKHLLYLASQHIASDTVSSRSRVEVAFKVVTSEIEINSGTEIVQKKPRYILQTLANNQNAWQDMDKVELAEYATMFAFEVYLEKQIHGTTIGGATIANAELAKASETPIDSPTEHDVLFGRGGMTNGHAGNRRFRDIIALHRPDYIRATKMDKPNVARRIVRAIRQGTPAGRFLKKSEDGKWYDVGDRTAAEKTSQGLRERSNAEKRQRSALRESERVLKGGEAADGAAPAKKSRIGSDVLSQATFTGTIPLSLSMRGDNTKTGKDKKSKKATKGKGEEEEESESLPPNATDADGNPLVTDYDILCGRGGLTNHHRGNKRFRDIVALHRPDYVRAPKVQKPSVARVIVRAIRNGDPPGRFLRKDEKKGVWVDIGDKKAAEKTSQALREKVNGDGKTSTPASFTSPTAFLPPDIAAGVAGAAAVEAAKPDAKKAVSPKKGAKDSEVAEV